MPPRDAHPQNPRAIDAVMVRWHENWKDVLNDHANRQFFCGRHVKWVTMADTEWKLDAGDRGTIFEDMEGDAAHYMAFAVSQQLHVFIFDPAGKGSDFYDPSVLTRARTKSGMPCTLVPLAPQRSVSDNFCQTWSLAWLLGGSYEEILRNAVTSMAGLRSGPDADIIEFSALSDICKMLMQSFTHVPNSDIQWQMCRDDSNLVLVNFVKFLETRADYRGDSGVARKLFKSFGM